MCLIVGGHPQNPRGNEDEKGQVRGKKCGEQATEKREEQALRKGASSTQSALWADDEGDRYSPPWGSAHPLIRKR